MIFKVSVIMPVYNAENYLRKAVESAVNLDEVGEIILVEDKSPDQALDLAFVLEDEYEKVKVFQHPDKGNHGAGASRNLGIKRANYDYISFLDADDYYLPNRFTQDQKVFLKYPECQGVYSATGTHFYTEKAKQQFFDNGFGYQAVLTINGRPEPEELFSVLFSRNKFFSGQFCTDGITVKKRLFDEVGLFNTELRLRQDIHLWKRMAAYGNLYAGEVDKPTAMRGIHEFNRMTIREDHKQFQNLWWETLKNQFTQKPITKDKKDLFLQCYYNYKIKTSSKGKTLVYFVKNCLENPSIVKKSYSDFDFNFWHIFGRNDLTLRLISFKNRLYSKD